MITAKLVFDAKNSLGEGPFWHDSQLYWLDILKGEVWCGNPQNGSPQVRSVGQMTGCLSPREEGGWIAGLHRGIALLDESFAVERYLLELADEGVRFNDGKYAPDGRYFAGTMRLDAASGGGQLYRVESSGIVESVLQSVTISNGLAWSADQKSMYYVDSPTRQVSRFDYDAVTGVLSSREVLVEIPAGWGDPDGICIDSEDNLWVALWGGYCVASVDTRKRTIAKAIEVPASQVTSCCLGGADGKTLYITTARVGLNAEQLKKEPLAGGVFQAKVKVGLIA